MKKYSSRLSVVSCFVLFAVLSASAQRAASPAKDFGCGTEYFNYLTKAASIHNEGPYAPKFDPKKWGVNWKNITLSHDWVVDLPYE